MAINLLEQLKDQIGDEVFSQAGQFLGADSSGVKSAMGAALPSILGSMISGSTSPSGAKGMMDMITSGGHDGSIFGNLGSLLGGGDATSGFLNSGSGILKSLMGDKMGSVVDIIASVSGLKKGASSSIMSMAAPLVMGMVGKYVKSKAMDAIGLTKFLGNQSKYVADALPAGMGSLLGITKIKTPNVNVGNMSNMGNKVEAAATSAAGALETSASGGSGLLKRVLPILLLLGVGYFAWDYFGGTKIADTVGGAANSVVEGTKNAANNAKDATVAMGDKASETAGNLADGAKNMANDAGEAISDAASKTGEMASDAMDATANAAKAALAKINFAAGSVGEKFSTWLASDATGTKTFQFNNLTFASGSSNIQDMKEVNNLAEVMKAYANVIVEVGGHTDSTGNAASNMTLSQARADAVKAQLVAQGIDGSRISTKGYGSTMPTTANAADAANRRVEVKATIK